MLKLTLDLMRMVIALKLFSWEFHQWAHSSKPIQMINTMTILKVKDPTEWKLDTEQNTLTEWWEMKDYTQRNKQWLEEVTLILLKELKKKLHQQQRLKLQRLKLLQRNLLTQMISPTIKLEFKETWSAECLELRPFTAQLQWPELTLPTDKPQLNQLPTINKN